MDPTKEQQKPSTATIEPPADDKRQPWKEWLEKDQEMIANQAVDVADIEIIDQTYLLEAEPSQTMG
jgi:hypothetical protein